MWGYPPSNPMEMAQSQRDWAIRKQDAELEEEIERERFTEHEGSEDNVRQDPKREDASTP